MTDAEEQLLADAMWFKDALVKRAEPIHTLTFEGVFPDGWPERYLDFLDRVETEYGKDKPIPRPILSVIYIGSVYCTKRFLDWRLFFNGQNSQTESMVHNIRLRADAFMLGITWDQQQ